jgi:hypothetical protein
MSSLSDYVPAKRVKRCALSQNEKIIILNVFNALKHQNPTNSVDDIVEKCSKMTGIGKSTIYRLLKETKNEQDTVNPPKSSTGRSKVVIDDFFKNVIRRKVHSFYFKKEIPTLNKILSELSEDNDLPKISRSKLWAVLRELNFCWEKQNRKSVLIDKDEIICWRRSYLRSIRKFRDEGRNIYYLDETWVNEGYTVTKVWQDKNVKSFRQAFLDGLSTGFKAPSGKGRRLIVTHIGSASGFVDGGLLLFESKNTGDYHEDMNADVFEEYFTQMLDLIPPGSVIVMDNASYHSRQTERTPTTAWRKADIIQWLSGKNISFETNMVKKELLTLVNLNKDQKKYVIDEMATNRQITVLRLPPYHCELNPIELVWAQVKGDVARNNTTFKLSDVKILLKNSLERVTADNWQRCIHHVQKEEEKMWELDNLIDVTVEPIVINLGDEDNSSEYSEDEF